MAGAGKVEKRRTVAFFHQTFGGDETIIALDHYLGPTRDIRGRNDRKLLMEAFPHLEHPGIIELYLFT